MPRLPRLSDSKIRSVLEHNGLRFQRWGKHGAIHVHPEDPTRRAEVPKRNPVGEGVLKIIIKTSQKDRSEFENL